VVDSGRHTRRSLDIRWHMVTKILKFSVRLVSGDKVALPTLRYESGRTSYGVMAGHARWDGLL
jgi:hypothetical protein